VGERGGNALPERRQALVVGLELALGMPARTATCATIARSRNSATEMFGEPSPHGNASGAELGARS
jgi:hypothetical protein